MELHTLAAVIKLFKLFMSALYVEAPPITIFVAVKPSSSRASTRRDGLVNNPGSGKKAMLEVKPLAKNCTNIVVHLPSGMVHCLPPERGGMVHFLLP